MKKILSIFLLISMIAPFVGTYGCLQYQKYLTRKKVKKELIAHTDKSKLLLLSFSKAQIQKELQWEHSREFEYKGEMYDVVEQEESKDSITYWCWWDCDETELNRKLTSLVDNEFSKDPKNHQKQEHLRTFFKTLYHQDSKVSEHIAESSLLHFSHKSILYKDFKSFPLFLPPELV